MFPKFIQYEYPWTMFNILQHNSSFRPFLFWFVFLRISIFLSRIQQPAMDFSSNVLSTLFPQQQCSARCIVLPTLQIITVVLQRDLDCNQFLLYWWRESTCNSVWMLTTSEDRTFHDLSGNTYPGFPRLEIWLLKKFAMLFY